MKDQRHSIKDLAEFIEEMKRKKGETPPALCEDPFATPSEGLQQVTPSSLLAQYVGRTPPGKASTRDLTTPTPEHARTAASLGRRPPPPPPRRSASPSSPPPPAEPELSTYEESPEPVESLQIRESAPLIEPERFIPSPDQRAITEKSAVRTRSRVSIILMSALVTCAAGAFMIVKAMQYAENPDGSAPTGSAAATFFAAPPPEMEKPPPAATPPALEPSPAAKAPASDPPSVVSVAVAPASEPPVAAPAADPPAIAAAPAADPPAIAAAPAADPPPAVKASAAEPPPAVEAATEAPAATKAVASKRSAAPPPPVVASVEPRPRFGVVAAKPVEKPAPKLRSRPAPATRKIVAKSRPQPERRTAAAEPEPRSRGEDKPAIEVARSESPKLEVASAEPATPRATESPRAIESRATESPRPAEPTAPELAKAVASAEPAAAPRTGKIDVPATRAAVRAQIGPVLQCYERARMDDPNLAGTVTTRITVAPDGAVAKIDIINSTLGAPTVEACIRQGMSRWRLPRPVGGASASLTYPLVFQ